MALQPPQARSTLQEPSRVTTPEAGQHIWYITGPAGCGKSTIAAYIATALNIPLVEGDLFHSPENVKNMAMGQPLTDADRWDWLATLRDTALQALSTMQTGSPSTHSGVVVTCSALKAKYRNVLRSVGHAQSRVEVHFIYLHAPEEVLTKRVMMRQGHYMPAALVRSQFEALEVPSDAETDVVLVNVEGTKCDVETIALRQVKDMLT